MAVNRRQKENDTFNDIALTLPIEENAKELDKASILRIAIHYLRLRDILADCEPDELNDEQLDLDGAASLPSSTPNFSKDVLQALDGFMLLVSREGKVLFASESISQYLGLRQVDVIGIDLQDIIHPQDFMDVAAIFQSQGHDVGPDVEALGSNHLKRNFVVRMRCAFTPSVRSVTRCSNFKPIYCSAFLKFSNKKIKEGEFLGMAAFCKVASVMKVKELCVGAYFKTKHALDLSYTAIDTRIRWILGFDPAKMVGAKAYNYFHPEDLLATSSCHVNLLSQGHSHSPCYRFMAQSGDWVWVRSKSCVTYDSITHRPNGLSIYTWIVRYDEEDERMKAISEGRDATNIGIKDLSQVVAPTDMDVKELSSTSSKPSSVLSTNGTPDNSPTAIASPQSHTTGSPQSHTSGSPQSHTTGSPQSHTTGSPRSHTIGSPQSYTSCPYSQQSNYSPVFSTSPPAVMSPPIAVSPEHSTSSVPPPNVNPFQSSRTHSVGGSPCSVQQTAVQPSPYDMSSPRHANTFMTDPPYNGGACVSTINGGHHKQMATPPVPMAATTNNPRHYKLSKISQSSTDSLKETSPPYTVSSDGGTVYNYSTSSPESSIGLGLMSMTESSPGSIQNQQYQTFADFQPSPAMQPQHSPLSGGHSPCSYSNPSPYSTDSMGMGGPAAVVPSPPQPTPQFAPGMNCFSIEATMFSPSLQTDPMFLDMSPPAGSQQPSNYQQQQYIKQEPTQYDSQYCTNTAGMTMPVSTPHSSTTGAMFHQKLSRGAAGGNNTYVSQAKARYTPVTLGGKRGGYHEKHVKQPTQEDATIMGISQWLQQGTSPHVY